jgi:magnesium chelatase subunit H
MWALGAQPGAALACAARPRSPVAGGPSSLASTSDPPAWRAARGLRRLRAGAPAAPRAEAGGAGAADPPPPPPPRDLRSEAERFVAALAAEAPPAAAAGDAAAPVDLRARRAALLARAAELQSELDAEYKKAFAGAALPPPPAGEPPLGDASEWAALDEAAFGALGRARPALAAALIAALEAADGAAWRALQVRVAALKARRGRAEAEAAAAGAAADAADARARAAAAPSAYNALSPPAAASGDTDSKTTINFVLVTGFESFNLALYRRAAVALARACSGARLQVFSDRDLGDRAEGAPALAAALAAADVLVASLLFDYDQVEWLRARAAAVPTRLVFESALELMALTKVGGFTMGAPGAGPAGPPPAVKKVLSLFSSGREEDKMVGYLSFLKIGPQLLKFLPGQKARDLRTWLTAYAYW